MREKQSNIVKRVANKTCYLGVIMPSYRQIKVNIGLLLVLGKLSMLDHDNRFLIVDGYSLFFRAFYSLPDMRTPSGLPIGAVYGFINMLLRLMQDVCFAQLVIVLDSGKKSFRNEIYPLYKAQRKEAPLDLKLQFPILHEAIGALRVAAIYKTGYEADDIIATYVKMYKSPSRPITIVSSDKDLMQLVEDDIVSMYDMGRKKIYKSEDVLKKFCIPAKAIAEYLALAGDASDNIPGAKSIGPKTAALLINTYHTIENLYANVQNIINPRLRKTLIENKEQVYKSKMLTTLCDNVTELLDEKELIFTDLDKNCMASFAEKYGFTSMISRDFKRKYAAR